VQIVVREAEAGDERFLWRMLFEAAHAGDEVDGVEALRQVPELARYVEGWGRPSDLGVVATNGDGEPVGAAWVRMLVGKDAAYGYVDDTTPELAIAVDPQRTGDGIGSQLLKRLLLDAERMFPAVSLSVRADNPARRLYERFGFQPVADPERTNRVGGASLTMVRRFTGR
jgi:ribosomal protein S18 acetylase RimI-like enzyme